MYKLGFEKEYFLRNKKGKLVLNPSKHGFTTDDLGILIEVRSEPKPTVGEAIADLLAKEIEAKALATTKGYVLVDESSVKLNAKEIVEMIAKYTEQVKDKFSEPLEYDTSKVSDKKRMSDKLSKLNAGFHIHFSKEEEKEIDVTKINLDVSVKPIGVARIVDDKADALSNSEVVHSIEVVPTKTTYVVNKFIDVPKVLMMLDDAFKDTIAKAKRLPSAYEVKEHGFEYRSLPNNIDMEKLSIVLCDIVKIL